MKHILVVSAVLILISIAENSLLLYNSITLTGIALLAYYIFNSWIIFRMVSEREYAILKQTLLGALECYEALRVASDRVIKLANGTKERSCITLAG